MIPLRLTLKNFLCYRDNISPISLEGIRLACLCGDNGAGKSALLDALTWALWGKARGKGDNDELVHAGQRETEVELEFQAGGRYRVTRRYTKAQPPRRSDSRLDLFLVTPQGQRLLNGNNQRETQRIIERDILHLDYDTFINSAFLLQGRADEFTNKTPGERKEVLGQILGLADYDTLAEKARASREERKREQEKLEQAIADKDLEIARKPQYLGEAEEIRAQLLKINGEITRGEVEIASLRQERERLKLKQQKWEEIERELEGTKRELESRQKELGQLHRQQEEYLKVANQRDEIEQGYSLFLEAKGEEEKLGGKLWRLQPLEGKRASLKDAIQQARSDLEKESGLLGQRLKDLQAQLARAAQMEGEWNSLHPKKKLLEAEEARLLELRQQYQALLQEIQRHKTVVEQKKGQGKELAQKLSLLETEEVSCPLCGTALGSDGVLRLQDSYQEEGQNLAQALAHLEKEIVQQESQQRSWETEIVVLDKRLRQERGLLQSRLGALGREREEAQKARDELPPLEGKLKGVEERLRQGQFALEGQRELLEVEAEVQSLGYSREQHQQARLRLQQWQSFEGRKAKLEEVIQLLPALESSLDREQQAIQSLLSQLHLKGKEAKELGEEVARLPQVERELAAKEREQGALKEKQGEAQRRWGGVEARIAHCRHLEEERALQEQKRQQAVEEAGIYDELVEAFGKKGIQALLIEQALPQLQEEADRLVKKLTDGRMNLNFKTQRETKKGEAVETLEIEIGDELGTRSYEMYSGGEAFRINFALRVALARLVAHRAGAPLSLLIIDEGFGTQDTQGQQHIIEAIRAISEEFDQVLVVTHVEELKEQFPVRLEVTKTEIGSMVQILS